MNRSLPANDDGFVEVTMKRVKYKAQPKQKIEGVRLSKPKPNFYYRPKSVHAVGETSSKQANEKSGDKGNNQVTNNMSTTNVSNYGRASSPKELDNQRMPLKNSFVTLVDEVDPTHPCNKDNEANNLGSDEDESDSVVMETIILEEAHGLLGDDQVMHARVWFKADKKELFCSFIYAHNRYTHRRTLWNSLCLHKHYVRNRPWCLLGDFNVALNLADHSAGSSNIDISMREFKDCVEEIEVLDDIFIGAHAIFQPYRISDHSPAVLKIPRSTTAVKGRVSKSRIDVVSDSNGVLFEADQVPMAFVNHYAAFLGQHGVTSNLNTHNLFTKKLDSNIAFEMIKSVTNQEVKDAIFSMGNDKFPRPDGYTTAFFKEAWDVVANDVTRAVQEFFTNDKLLKELNHTIIAFIPKVPSPSRINSYRPISCYNVLFKCISKIISNRIKESLKSRPPRCAFKVDIQKAYDTVDWGFLKQTLLCFGFHDRMIHWIMECVTSTSFSLSINGVLHGYFKGQRGLHQGDPMSPYLFTLIMEILTLILQRRVREDNSFTYHRYCDKLDIINLYFTDDLFLFAHGDAASAQVIMGALHEFKLTSGLTPSLPKRTAYFCNVLNHTKLSILNILPFEEGHLPVKGKTKVAWEVVCLPKKEGGIGSMYWPHDWISKYPALATIVVPNIVSNAVDELEWCDSFGTAMDFSVSSVWECIRPRGDEITLCDVV
ncbi:hypothetical protein Tco_1092831 [Tanacetum coccineum]|uniref:Reverse transcriptase domain-containing protein n=1 Tax=Tanacetum coccineum TaxID=301880 RepID=A0ABQ5ID43_9ASTR